MPKKKDSRTSWLRFSEWDVPSLITKWFVLSSKLSSFFHSDTFLESPFLLPKEWWALTTILFLSYPSVPTLGPLSYIASVISLKCPWLGEDKFYTSFIHIKEDNDCVSGTAMWLSMTFGQKPRQQKIIENPLKDCPCLIFTFPTRMQWLVDPNSPVAQLVVAFFGRDID